MSNFIINPYKFGAAGWDLDENFEACTDTNCDGKWLGNDLGTQFVDTTNNWIRWEVIRGTSQKIVYNLNTLLGGDVSATAFVWQETILYDILGADNPGNQNYIGLFSTPYTTAQNIAQDSLYWFYNKWAGAQHSRTCQCDNEAPDAAVGGDDPFGSTQDFPRTEDINYYNQIIRLSSTSVNWIRGENADFSSPIQSGTGSIPSTLGDSSNPLNYVGHGNESAGSNVSPMRINTPNIKFANGVTVAP